MSSITLNQLPPVTSIAMGNEVIIDQYVVNSEVASFNIGDVTTNVNGSAIGLDYGGDNAVTVWTLPNTPWNVTPSYVAPPVTYAVTLPPPPVPVRVTPEPSFLLVVLLICVVIGLLGMRRPG